MVTELWVADRFHRRGFGTRLMNLAKQKAKEQGRRAIILETQSCNVRAIAFYRSQGFRLIGFDTCCYANNDVARHEVRFNFGFYLNAKEEKPVQIRRAAGEELLALWGCPDLALAPPTARFFYQNITGGNAVFWTLDRGGELIGELYAFFDLPDKDFADGETTAYLCAFRVKQEYRGQGWGSRLMAAALAELQALGFRRATIGVSCDEPRNQSLYRRFGFTEKIKDCHYDPCGMDEDMQPLCEDAAWELLAGDLTGPRGGTAGPGRSPANI
jgi:ribosomal protein S18 acetylase RimI-like enzyme